MTFVRIHYLEKFAFNNWNIVKIVFLPVFELVCVGLGILAAILLTRLFQSSTTSRSSLL